MTNSPNSTSVISNINTELTNWSGPLGLPDFSAIKDTDYEPAFETAILAYLNEIEAIAGNSNKPDFDNTIVALEMSGEMLDKIASIFWNLTGSHSNETLQALERKMAPELSRLSSKISQNRQLFARIDALYQNQAALELNAEQARVLEKAWKRFVRSGAALDSSAQKQLATVNERLAMLGTNFAQNILADEAEYALFLEKSDLTGLPASLVSAMADAAKGKDQKSGFAVTLSRSIIEPFLMFSDRRDLREVAFKAWVSRGESAERDNVKLVSETVMLRAEKATLLGYNTFADFKLDDTMAKSPNNVRNLLETVWEKAKTRAREEQADIAELIAAEGKNHEVAPWDWRYYSEKVRAQKFDFDATAVKPYLELNRMIEAAFSVANRLFGITFKEHHNVPSYHEDVRTFEVLDASGASIAIFLGDYFARPSKRSGAWMSGFQQQHKLGKGRSPIILNNMNFAKAPQGEPVLLSMDDARTLFHEFGHALHGMLSNVTFPSISGTSVSRDFVELPSQLYEHWLMVPQILSEFATHYETGAQMPAELLVKLKKSETFNKGFDTVEFTASALVDMAFHELDVSSAKDVDPMQFQSRELARIGMPDAIVMRHATPHFAHVFSGDGYSAGYYSYMWSGVLDADAFKAFEEVGDPFDPAIAKKLYSHIYSSGGSRDPELAYKAFRGRLPSVDALLEKQGLAA